MTKEQYRIYQTLQTTEERTAYLTRLRDQRSQPANNGATGSR